MKALKVQLAASFVAFAMVLGLMTAASVAGASAQASSGSTSACVAGAKKVISNAEKTPKFSVPPIPGGVAKVKGDTAWFITDATIPLLNTQATAFADAMKEAGVSVKTFDSKGTYQLDTQGIEEAVGANANLIVTDAVTLSDVRVALQQAITAKIPVESLYESPSTSVAKEAVKAVVLPTPKQIGQVFAAYGMAQDGCKLKLGIMYSHVLDFQIKTLNALKQYVNKQCPSTCTVYTYTYTLADRATIGSQATSFVISHPSMNQLVLESDTAATFVVPALTAAHKNVPIIAYGGTTSDLTKYVKKNLVLKADIANYLAAVGWTAADAGLRVMTGHPVSADDTIYTRLLTAQNIPKTVADYFPFAYKTDFKKAWGV